MLEFFLLIIISILFQMAWILKSKYEQEYFTLAG